MLNKWSMALFRKRIFASFNSVCIILGISSNRVGHNGERVVQAEAFRRMEEFLCRKMVVFANSAFCFVGLFQTFETKFKITTYFISVYEKRNTRDVKDHYIQYLRCFCLMY